MVSKEKILSVASEEELFRRFISYRFIPGKAFRSELREDHHPSACVYINQQGRWIYKDFAGESYDIFGYVMEKYHTDFVGALNIIASELGLSDDNYSYRELSHIPKIPKIPKEERATFKWEDKPWEDYERAFWDKYGVTEAVLNEYGIRPLLWVAYIKEEIEVKRESDPTYPIFYFPIPVEEDIGEKFYFPYEENKQKKWWSNTRVRHIFGLSQIKKIKGRLDKLGILAGQKDVLSLYSNTGIRSVTLNSESSALHPDVFLYLQEKTDFLFVLYDNDKTGQIRSLKISKQFNIPRIDISQFTGYCTLKGSGGINDTADWYKLFIREERKYDKLNMLIEKAYERERCFRSHKEDQEAQRELF